MTFYQKVSELLYGKDVYWLQMQNAGALQKVLTHRRSTCNPFGNILPEIWSHLCDLFAMENSDWSLYFKTYRPCSHCSSFASTYSIFFLKFKKRRDDYENLRPQGHEQFKRRQRLQGHTLSVLGDE